MSKQWLLSLFLFASTQLQAAWSTETAQKTPVLAAPTIFAPGVISGPGGDGTPSFSPDGKTLYFTRSAARWSVILESHQVDGKWSTPKVASFSGEWPDASPAMAPDGSYLVFVSTRPLKGAPGSSSHIWRVNRTASGWSEPVELPPTVNFCQSIFRPSVASDGSLYFTAAGQGKELRLFQSHYLNGEYQKAEPLPFSDGNVKDVDPEIAPDKSFLIFTRLATGEAHEKLFIVRNKAGVWGEVTPLRYAGDDANGSSEDNDPRLGSDRQTVYFSSDRSLAVHFPRTREQAQQDFERMETWDNGNTNVWVLVLGEGLS